jgi:hypothetical protein
MEYWQDSPPVHELVAGYLGVKPKKRRPQSYATEAQILAMAKAMGG